MNVTGKLLILALDGLEYNTVHNAKLTHLQQRQYGKLVVPIHPKHNAPSSPEVWATFLTGKHIRKSMKRILKETNGKHGHLSRFPELNQTTFLDVTNSKAVNVPYYNYDNAFFDAMYRFCVSNVPTLQAIEELTAIYERRKRQVFKEVSEWGDADVIFAFIHFPDALQHWCLFNRSVVHEHYFDLDNYVGFLSIGLEDDVTFIIISDHGFDWDKSLHSKHGFYSINRPLTPSPTKITDFYDYIVERRYNALRWISSTI